MNNYSKQREIILNTMYTLKHPTAEELYKVIHKSYPTISKSTIYRNLGILVENNIIKKIKILNGADRFDCIEKEHCHAICENCGKVFDFIYYFMQEELKNVVENQTGLTSLNNINVYGICEECKSKNEEE